MPAEDKGFEDLCCLIAQKKYLDPDAQKYGSAGQKQFGIDILASDNTQTPPQKVVIQCKFKEDPRNFSDAEAKSEILKELDKAIKGKKGFNKFVYTINTKRRTQLQDFAKELTQEHGFDVIVWSIDDIKETIEASEKLTKIYTVSDFHQYGEVKIQQKLNTSPVNPTVFIGRDDEPRGTLDIVSVLYVVGGIPVIAGFLVGLFLLVGACDQMNIMIPG
ncbi:MAG: hypothetical protein MJK04_12625 [Psychrosphaera sp.]|nr:hypothetical protein [Psychrosphaera sp.]